jgi:predicted nucleic acid-binding protein
VFLSVIKGGELKRGIDKIPDSKRRRRLSNWLNGDLLVRFGERVLPINVAVALAWGSLVAQTRAAGTPIPAIDSLVAATAAVHGSTLVTLNVGDFEAAAIPLLNPWLDQA